MKKIWKWNLLFGVVLLLGISGVYALPKAYVLYRANTGKVAIHLEEYRIEDGKEIPWKKTENVLPGSQISKIPKIYNDGADCYVRARVEFISQNTSGQPLCMESLEGIQQDWIQKGDYFYYKKVVPAGEHITFFHGIRIPADWKEEEQENVWQARVKAEAIQSECFSPDFSRQDPWNLEAEQIRIQQAGNGETMDEKKGEEQVELVIAADMQGFSMKQEGCMQQLETFVPGKSQSGKVVLKNNTSRKREVFICAESPRMNELLEKMELTVQIRDEKNIQVLYQGKVSEKMLEEFQSVGYVLPGKDKTIEFLFALPKDADNAYAVKTGEIKFWFTTDNPGRMQIVSSVKTGDNQKGSQYLCTGILALLLVLCIGKIMEKGKRQKTE